MLLLGRQLNPPTSSKRSLNETKHPVQKRRVRQTHQRFFTRSHSSCHRFTSAPRAFPHHHINTPLLLIPNIKSQRSVILPNSSQHFRLFSFSFSLYTSNFLSLPSSPWPAHSGPSPPYSPSLSSSSPPAPPLRTCRRLRLRRRPPTLEPRDPSPALLR